MQRHLARMFFWWGPMKSPTVPKEERAQLARWALKEWPMDPDRLHVLPALGYDNTSSNPAKLGMCIGLFPSFSAGA